MMSTINLITESSMDKKPSSPQESPNPAHIDTTQLVNFPQASLSTATTVPLSAETSLGYSNSHHYSPNAFNSDESTIPAFQAQSSLHPTSIVSASSAVSTGFPAAAVSLQSGPAHNPIFEPAHSFVEDPTPLQSTQLARSNTHPLPESHCSRPTTHTAFSKPQISPDELIDPIDKPQDWIDRVISTPYGVWALYFMTLGTGAAFFRYDSVYYDRRGIQESEIGLIKGLFPLSQAIGGFLFPRLADSTRQHRTIIILTTLFTCLLWTSVAFKPVYSHTSMIMLISVLGGLLGGALAPMVDAFGSLMMRYNKSSYGTARLWSAFGWGFTSFATGMLLERSSVYWIFILYTSGQLLAVGLLIVFYHLTRVEKRLAQRTIVQLKVQEHNASLADQFHAEREAISVDAAEDYSIVADQYHDASLMSSYEPHVMLPSSGLILSEETAGAIPSSGGGAQPGGHTFSASSAIAEAVDVVHGAVEAVTTKLGLHSSTDAYDSSLLTGPAADTTADASSTAHSDHIGYAPMINNQQDEFAAPEATNDGDVTAGGNVEEIIPEGSLSAMDPRVLESDPAIQQKIMYPATRRQAHFAAFWVLGNLVVFGMLMSVVEYYLFLFAEKELGATTDLMGYATLIMTMSEVPWFWFADRILARFPLKWIFIITEFSFAIRTFCYTLIPRSHPWLLLFLEPFHGMNFALMWSAAVQAGIHFAPKGVESTYQGTINAAYQGCGMAIGAVLGGFIFQEYGSVALFRVTSVAAVVWCVILVLFFPSHSFYRYRKHPFFAVPAYVLPNNQSANNVDDDDASTSLPPVTLHDSSFNEVAALDEEIDSGLPPQSRRFPQTDQYQAFAGEGDNQPAYELQQFA